MTENDSFDKSLAFQLHNQTMLETEKMLRTLAIRLSQKTTIIPGTRGSYKYRMAKPNLCNGATIDEYTIELIRFFGMAIGYNSEFDVLIYWDSNDKNGYKFEWELLRKDTIELLKDLGEVFNRETKFYVVPKHMTKAPVLHPPKNSTIDDYNTGYSPDIVPIKRTVVDLIPFFGMVIGFDKEENVLLYRVD